MAAKRLRWKRDEHPGFNRSTEYRYDPLPGSRFIRLLILHPSTRSKYLECDLDFATLDDHPHFEALSYVWGIPEPRKAVNCGKSSIKIGPNLHSALMHLRYRFRERVLWADALCINQEDIPERNAQVALMAEIYSTAARTLIWLGEQKDAEGSLQSLRRVRKYLPKKGIDEYRKNPPSGIFERLTVTWRLDMLPLMILRHRKEFHNLAPLICLPWFGRKWVIQELIKSREAVIILGKTTIPWHFLEDTVAWLGNRNFLDVIAEKCLRPEIETHDVNISTMHILRTQDWTLDELVISSISYKCTDPRDHIISLLGLASDGERARARIGMDPYSQTPEELYRRLALRSIFEEHSLILFSLQNCEKPSNSLASWIPNLASLESTTRNPSASLSVIIPWMDSTPPQASRADPVSASLINDGSVLLLKGKLVTLIEKIGSRGFPTLDVVIAEKPNNPSETQQQTYMRLLASFFRDCETTAFDQGQPDNSWTHTKFLRALCWDYTGQLGFNQEFQLELFIKRVKEGSQPTVGMRSRFSGDVLSRLPLSAGRHFFRTRESWAPFGWAPLHAARGDLVVIFDGAKVPHVIRPTHRGTYKLLGDCYIDGLMLGEIEIVKSLKSEEIALE
jgi:Heterokaryon incompatibility protein (HET)